MSEPGNELAHRPDPGGAMTVSKAMADSAAMLSMIRDLALDPSISAEKLRVVSDVANTQQDRAEKREFYQAKGAALLELPVIDKRGRIVIEGKNGAADRVQGTFAKWPDLQRAIYPVLAKHNLALTHDVGHDDGCVTVTPILQHTVNGYVERGEAMRLPLDSSGGKNNTQGAASAASYGKRHTAVAMLGIRLDNADDDGQLLALPDEPLNDRQQRLVAVAEDRSKVGSDSYMEWFGQLEPKDRAWLIQTGRHETFGGTTPSNATTSTSREQSPTPSQSRRPPAQQTQQKAGKHDTTTAKGWTDQYVEDCEACKSIEALDELKRKAGPALNRLTESHPSLWEKADAAELEARERLKSGGML